MRKRKERDQDEIISMFCAISEVRGPFANTIYKFSSGVC